MVEIQVTADNTDEVLRELERKVQAALEACGIQATTHAEDIITAESRIDTSNLINNISHLVKDDTCYVGTDVEYAIYNEFGTGIYADGGKGRKTPWAYKDENGKWHRTRGMKPIHFLKNAVADHIEEYKAIMENELQK